MNDRDLVRKIKMVKIEPSQDWVSLTRRGILGSEEPQFGWLAAHWRPFLAGLTLSLVLVGGLLGLIRFGQEGVVVEDPVSSPLVVLEEPLVVLKDQMVNLKEQIVERETESVQPKSQQALEIRQMVLGIRDLTQAIEEVDQDRVLTALSADLETAGEEVKLAFLERELEDLQSQREQGLLNSEKMLILSEVEELYQSREYEDAFWRLMEIIN